MGNSAIQIPPPQAVDFYGPSVDCMVTEWSQWSQCSTTCGTGYSEKIRMIKRPAENGGKPCPKRLEKRRKCNIRPCY